MKYIFFSSVVNNNAKYSLAAINNTESCFLHTAIKKKNNKK